MLSSIVCSSSFGISLRRNLLDLVAKTRSLFHAQSRTGAEVQTNQAGINLRKEILPQKEHQSER